MSERPIAANAKSREAKIREKVNALVQPYCQYEGEGK